MLAQYCIAFIAKLGLTFIYAHGKHNWGTEAKLWTLKFS